MASAHPKNEKIEIFIEQKYETWKVKVPTKTLPFWDKFINSFIDEKHILVHVQVLDTYIENDEEWSNCIFTLINKDNLKK